MTTRSRCVAALLVLAGAACAEAPRAASGSLADGGIRRTLLERTPAHEPGWETRLYLIEYAPHAAAPPHVHPAGGVGFVVEGEFESAFGDAPTVTVRAGEGFVDLPDVPHRVFRNPSASTTLRFVIAYTIAIGAPTFRPLP